MVIIQIILAILLYLSIGIGVFISLDSITSKNTTYTTTSNKIVYIIIFLWPVVIVVLIIAHIVLWLLRINR
jgi:hypothetical protein